MSDLVRHVAVPSVGGATLARSRPAAWWGAALAIVTEAMLFVGLLSSYSYLRANASEWPLGDIEPSPLFPTLWWSLVLVGSSLPMHLAERGIRNGHVGRLRAWMALAFVMGAAFLVFTIHDLAHARFPIDENAYASIFHVTIGLHALHLAVALGMSSGVQIKAATGRLDGTRHRSVRIVTMYWHFVDAVWIAVFSTLYLSTR